MLEEPFIPFYKPYGMSDEEYEKEVKLAEERHAEWEEQNLQEHLEDCKNGKHHFVSCDEWEPTCIYCGKFQ